MSFNPPKVAEWQWLDESCGLWYPWYTLPALEEISKWDLMGKNVLELGGGRSTIWWAKHVSGLTTIERDKTYFDMICKNGFDINPYCNSYFKLSSAKEGIQNDLPEYLELMDLMNGFTKFDIVIVDDIFRYECMVKALTLPRPLTLIVDNWQQDYVFICPAAVELMKDFEGQFFTQPDHTNHEGNPWTTAIWHLK